MALLDQLGKFAKTVTNAIPAPPKKGKIYSPPGVYGSDSLREGNDIDISAELAPSGSTGIVLGVDQPGTTMGASWYPSIGQGHALTFGATRSGKGVAVIIPTLLTYRGSVLVVDPKAEAVWVTADRRRQLGQRVVILDPWDETNRRYSRGADQLETLTKFNPLSALDPTSRDFADDVAAIADALVIADAGMESHWVNSARELISGLVAAAVEGNPGKASLRQVRKLLTAPTDDLAKIITSLVAANPNSLAGRKLRRFAQESTGTEIASIRSTAETQTAILDSEVLLDAMETNDPVFELDELGNRPT